MIILCEYCDLRCVCYDDWMEHLLSDQHQDVISEAINSWEAPLNERSLVITINGTKPNKTDICWYFANYGLVADAFFETNLEFCVIQLDKKDYAENALLTEHYLENCSLTLRLKANILEDEWLVLNSMIRRNGTKETTKPTVAKEPFESRHSRLTEILKSIPVDSQIDTFGGEIKMKTSNITLRQQLLHEMTKIFKKHFPKSVLCPYGSFVTGLGEDMSTFKIYFDATGQSLCSGKGTETRILSKKETIESFQKIVENVNRVTTFCHSLTSAANEKIASVSFTHCDTEIRCKFTFDDLHPVQTSKLIALVMELDPRLPTLFLLLKYWGECNKLTGENQMSNYSLNLLLLVFLTKKKIIPSISVLQTMSSAKKEANGWDTSFCDETAKIVNLMSFFGTSSAFDKDPTTGNPTTKAILLLVIDFCKMYAHTDLQSQVVCSAMGDFLPKTVFAAGKENDLPKPLEAYKTKVIKRSAPRLNTNSLLCIQDPFNLSCNVSGDVPEDVIWQFQFACADTVDNIETVFTSPKFNLMDAFKSPSSLHEEEEKSTKSIVIDHNHTSITSLPQNPSVNPMQTGNIQNANIIAATQKDKPIHNVLSQPKITQSVYPTVIQPISHSETSSAVQKDKNTISQTNIAPRGYPNPPQPPNWNKNHPQQQQPSFVDYQHNSIPTQQNSGYQQFFPHTSNSSNPRANSNRQEDQYPTSSVPSSGHFSKDGAPIKYPEIKNEPKTKNLPQKVQESSSNVGLSKQPMDMGSKCKSSDIVKSIMKGKPVAPPPPTSTTSSASSSPQSSKASKWSSELGSSCKGGVGVNKVPAAVAATTTAPKTATTNSIVTTPVSTPVYTMVKLPSNYSLKFGDIERIFKIPIEEQFGKVFKENVGNLVSEASTKIRLNTLWCVFMKDFLTDIWWKGFQFEVAEATQFNIPLNRDKRWKEEILEFIGSKKEEDSHYTNAKKQKIDIPIKYLFDPRSNPHKTKFFDLQVNFAHNTAFLCTFRRVFADEREKMRKKVVASEQDLASKLPNPLDWEGEISKRVADLPPHRYDTVCKCQFVIKVALDGSTENPVSLAIKDIKSDNSKAKGINSSAISHIISVIRDSIPKYQIYRLNQWLALNS